ALRILGQGRYPIRYGPGFLLDACTWDRPFDHPKRRGRAAIHGLAAQDDASRDTPAAKTRQPLRTARTRNQPDTHFRQTQLRLFGCDPQIATQGQLETAS